MFVLRCVYSGIQCGIQSSSELRCILIREGAYRINVTNWLYILLTFKITNTAFKSHIPIFFQFGIPVHEIGHVLGMWHEQQRWDRDEYIRVLYENLGYYSGQFAKFPTVSYGVPYDYGSVLHYSPKVSDLLFVQ